ncbi:MAG: hypothetical protein JWR20_1590 [Marmoricola sp.]|nr:hypothetical protein [Marmoricola sp.]
MSRTTAPATPVAGAELPTVPLAQLAPWAALFGLLAVLTLFFVGAEQGAVSVFSGTWIHEFAHDGRHLLAFPCH